MGYYDDKVYTNSSCREHITLTNLYKRLSKSKVSFVTDDFESLVKVRGPPNRILVMFLNPKIKISRQLLRKSLLEMQPLSRETKDGTWRF